MEGRELKNVGELNPLLSDYRSSSLRHSPGASSPSMLLQAMESGHLLSPSAPHLKNEPSSPADRSPQFLHSDKTPAYQTPYLKGGQSAPAKLHSGDPLKSNSARASSPPCSTGGGGGKVSSGQSHPLATSTTSIPRHTGGRKPPSLKPSDSGCSASTGQGTCAEAHSSPGQATTVQKVNEVESGPPGSSGNDKIAPHGSKTCSKASETDKSDSKMHSEVCGCTSAVVDTEEARRQRQLQQRLKKEEWQRKYGGGGLTAKRHSEGSLPEEPAGGREEGDDGFHVHELTTDGMGHIKSVLLVYGGPFRKCAYIVKCDSVALLDW